MASRGKVAPETEVSVTLSHHWQQWHILFDSPASVSIFHFYEVSAKKCVRAILEESNSKCHFRIVVTRVIWHICRWMPRPPATTSTTQQSENSFALTLLEYQVFQQNSYCLNSASRCSSLIIPSRWHWLIVPNPPRPLVWRVRTIPRTVASS